MNLLFIILFFTQFMQESLVIGVVDRLEGEKAVILIEEIGTEAVMERNEQMQEDKWYLLFWRDKEPLIISPLPAISSEMNSRSEKLMEKLREKEPAFNLQSKHQLPLHMHHFLKK